MAPGTAVEVALKMAPGTAVEMALEMAAERTPEVTP
jgi:hypothetical protein